MERTDGRHGAGILLDVLVGTERIFAAIDLLEVPAVVDLFTPWRVQLQSLDP